MSDEEIIMECALILGWTRPKANSVLWLFDGGEQWADKDHLPNPLKDLNVCHRLEKKIVECGGCYTHYVSYLQEETEHNEWRATAYQRTKSLLRTLNKWKE